MLILADVGELGVRFLYHSDFLENVPIVVYNNIEYVVLEDLSSDQLDRLCNEILDTKPTISSGSLNSIVRNKDKNIGELGVELCLAENSLIDLTYSLQYGLSVSYRHTKYVSGSIMSKKDHNISGLEISYLAKVKGVISYLNGVIQ